MERRCASGEQVKHREAVRKREEVQHRKVRRWNDCTVWPGKQDSEVRRIKTAVQKGETRIEGGKYVWGKKGWYLGCKIKNRGGKIGERVCGDRAGTQAGNAVHDTKGQAPVCGVVVIRQQRLGAGNQDGQTHSVRSGKPHGLR